MTDADQMTILQLRWTPEIIKDSHGAFTALCRELGLGAAGQTEEEARLNLKRMVESFCLVMKQKGLLDQAIAESGIRSTRIEREGDPNETVLELLMVKPCRVAASYRVPRLSLGRRDDL